MNVGAKPVFVVPDVKWVKIIRSVLKSDRYIRNEKIDFEVARASVVGLLLLVLYIRAFRYV